MSMTIRVGVKPEALTRLAGAAASGSPIKPSAGLGFLDLAAREVARKAGEVSKEEMTLQEYKQYISARISAIRIDPSHALESLRVQISDEGLKAMKTDGDYETWVLEMLEKAWSTPSTGMPGTFITYNIGAEREDFRVDTTNPGRELEALKKLDDETETFWERRHRRHEEYIELAQREAFLRKMRSGTVSAAELLLNGLV